MAITHDNVISTLNDLIETCQDGQEGFQTAAEGIRAGSIKSLCQQYAQQRTQFLAELRNEVRRLGGEPSGSVAGALHRGWLDIKSAVTGKDEHAVLAECERGEEAAIKSYEEALSRNLPMEVEGLIRHQYNAIKYAHDRVRSLRDTPRTATA